MSKNPNPEALHIKNIRPGLEAAYISDGKLTFYIKFATNPPAATDKGYPNVPVLTDVNETLILNPHKSGMAELSNGEWAADFVLPRELVDFTMLTD